MLTENTQTILIIAIRVVFDDTVYTEEAVWYRKSRESGYYPTWPIDTLHSKVVGGCDYEASGFVSSSKQMQFAEESDTEAFLLFNIFLKNGFFSKNWYHRRSLNLSSR